MILQRSKSRNGLTLLEVVMAMFIFLISSIAIWQLVTMGSVITSPVTLSSKSGVIGPARSR